MWGHYKKRISAGLRLSGAGGLSFLCLCLFGGSALAEFESPKSEYFTGFEASDNYASGYVGAGYALGKAGLYEPGFRLRAVGAYGRYCYDGALLTDHGYVPATFDGRTRSSRRLQDTSSAPGVSSPSCLPASRPRTSISYRTIPTTRCRAARWV